MATTDIQTNKNTNDGHNRYTDQQKHYNMMATTDIQRTKIHISTLRQKSGNSDSPMRLYEYIFQTTINMGATICMVLYDKLFIK